MSNEKDMTKDEKACSIVCQRCGRCCRAAIELLHGDATTRDVACWIGEGRYDILEWVGPFMIPDSEDAMFDIWVNLKTQDFVNRCPWLRKQKGADVYGCAIHDVKPAVCREWPSNIERGKKLGCPACQEKSPDEAGKGIKAVDPGRDDD